MRTVVAPLVVKTDTRLHTFRQEKPESKRATSADGDRIVRIRFGIELLSKPFTQKDDVSHLIAESFYPAWRKADRQILQTRIRTLFAHWLFGVAHDVSRRPGVFSRRGV